MASKAKEASTVFQQLKGGYVKPYRNSDKNNVTKLEKRTLGNVTQWITIRGKHKDLPILLFLHGGPGSPQTGAQMYYNADLEDDFLVVNWDQRGSGKSYSPEVTPESMNVEQLLSDCYELVKYLTKQFRQKKVFLMGHSVGAVLGLLFVQKFPELVEAYVGINQPVKRDEEEIRSYQFALSMAKAKNHKKAILQLERIGSPKNGFYHSVDDLVTQRTWLTKFNGVTYKLKAASVNIHYILSSHLTLKEKLSFMKGFGFSSTHLWDELTKINFFHLVSEVNVPVYFIAGKHDRIVFSDRLKEYYDFLKAPKKEIYFFEESGHYACFEEANKFNLIMKEVKNNHLIKLNKMEVI